MLNHGTARRPKTLEGQVVRLCDKISYIHHDMDDAERAGILREADIPADLRGLLGESTRERLNTFIHDIVRTSLGREQVEMSAEIGGAMRELRAFLFENLYSNPTAKSEEIKAVSMLKQMYEYYVNRPERMPKEYYRMIIKRGEEKERVVCDYISGMTDQYSKAKFGDIYIPKSWSKY